MRSRRQPEAKPNQRQRLVDDEVGRDQPATGLERCITRSRAGPMRRRGGQPIIGAHDRVHAPRRAGGSRSPATIFPHAAVRAIMR
jgi:hypothetical protein